jgi:hypothetical protein
MPRFNTALVLNFVLMLLSATPAVAMAADPQVSTEVIVERGNNPAFELQQAPALVYSTAPRHTARCLAPVSLAGAVGGSAG